MRTKNSEIAVKIFLLVVSVILVGLIIAWSTGVFKDKRNDLNQGTEKINDVLGTMADFDLLIYDGNIISGERVADLIEEVKEKKIDMAIGVKTIAASEIKFYNYSLVSGSEGDKLGSEQKDTPPTKKTEANYINPKGKFKGEVRKDENDNIIGLVFEQEK
ncbi:hypothetical protein [Herbinix luporum]|jgi:hypothetical protein|uniref:Uncharacterized protein n=1 Tax=Herbinix luporum TaxID=1679721 RepID=A0A0K8J6L2_9FIRM|nr:hypothetical protein [Herbinix luporum]CUH93236.1 hypothetical protein SD1D_1691 [Herbinix luporum]HHT57785.1 hypothetical protein [Herbinix luporum]